MKFIALSSTSCLESLIFKNAGIKENEISKISLGELKDFILDGVMLKYNNKINSILPVSIWETSDENYSKLVSFYDFKMKQCVVGNYYVNVLYK